MKKDIGTVNWAKICYPIENGGLKINNLKYKNNAYFSSLLEILLIVITLGLFS